jgi:hypothetical protein
LMVHPLVPSEGDDPRPWCDEDLGRLAALLGGAQESSWQLSGQARGSIYALRGRVQCRLTLTLDAPGWAASAELAGAVEVLQASVPPALGMAFDPGSADGELVMSGLHALPALAPVAYFDAICLQRLGGAGHVADAPCPVQRLADGLALEVRAVDCHDPGDPCMARATAVADYLGISAATPARLV